VKTPAPSAKNVPGSAAEARVKGARPSKPTVIDRRFNSDPRGGAAVVARDGVEVKDNRSKIRR
jgi:hypothetical protein